MLRLGQGRLEALRRPPLHRVRPLLRLQQLRLQVLPPVLLPAETVEPLSPASVRLLTMLAVSPATLQGSRSSRAAVPDTPEPVKARSGSGAPPWATAPPVLLGV